MTNDKKTVVCPLGFLMLTFPALLIILVIIAFAYCEAHKSYWDGKVAEMCEKDGGVRVNERVVATSQYVDKDGNIRIPPNANRENPFEWEAKPNDLFYYETEINEIKNGWLAVKQFGGFNHEVQRG